MNYSAGESKAVSADRDEQENHPTVQQPNHKTTEMWAAEEGNNREFHTKDGFVIKPAGDVSGQMVGDVIKEFFDHQFYVKDTQKKIERILAAKTAVRAIDVRPNSHKFNMARAINAQCLMVQILGEEAEEPCRHCSDQHGPFRQCVTLENYLAGSCANCAWNSSGSRCSLRPSSKIFKAEEVSQKFSQIESKLETLQSENQELKEEISKLKAVVDEHNSDSKKRDEGMMTMIRQTMAQMNTGLPEDGSAQGSAPAED